MKNILSRYVLTAILVLSFAATLPVASFSQAAATAAVCCDAQLAAIESKIDARRKELGIPGVSLAIVKDGKVIYAKGLGYKDFDKKLPVTADTQFAIGSATKAFTALSVLMSQDEGKLSLDDSPKKYLSYFKMYDPETDANIKIRDLLRHSSGLNRTDLAMITGKLNRAELIQVAAQAKPTAKLGEKFQYQNIMFTAAGEIVAQVQKEPWEKFVPQRIFAPLGMTNSTLSLDAMKQAKDHSLGYEYNFDTKVTKSLPLRDIIEVAPAGSINSSANDMAKWISFILDGGVVNGKRLVSEKGFAEWFAPQMKIAPKMSYGLGWFLQDWNGLKVAQHGGNIDGFNSMVAMIPEKQLGFVLLTNVSASSLGGEAMDIIWSNLLPGSVPAAPKADNGSKPEAAVDYAAAKELIGKYNAPNGGVVDVKDDGGKVTFNIAGQQPYTLVPRAAGGYSMQPLPADFWLKAKRDDAGKLVSIMVTQPQGEFEFKLRAADEKPIISTDELMAKMIDALGGEANLRKIKTRIATFDTDFESQGVKGDGTTWSKAPAMSATRTDFVALGKTIASEYEYFDGKAGRDIVSFAPSENYAGRRLEDARVEADLYAPLDWKVNYRSVDVIGIKKVGDEDCYIVRYTSDKGTNATEFVSTKTFLVVRRIGEVPSSTSSQTLPYTADYSDYREIDGVKIPFRTKVESISMGSIVTTIKTVRHNTPIDNSIFAPIELGRP